jgi:hypothetical protein
MARFVFQALNIMRLALSRRNQNDPDSSTEVFISYLSDFASLTQSDDVKLFEQFQSFDFQIQANTPVNDGIYPFDASLPNGVGITGIYVNEALEAFIADEALLGYNWNPLEVYMNPFTFYDYWGPFSVGQDPNDPNNNQKVLVPGFPTWMLIYQSQLVFRTVPQLGHSYRVRLFNYKQNPDILISGVNNVIPFDYWLRYWAWGAALNYARDYRYSPESLSMIERNFYHERKLLLTRTHNQIKQGRCIPKF